MAGAGGEGSFGDHGEGVEFGEGLGVELDVGVVGLEIGGDDLAALDGLAMPAVAAEGVDDGLELEGRRTHGTGAVERDPEVFSRFNPQVPDKIHPQGRKRQVASGGPLPNTPAGIESPGVWEEHLDWGPRQGLISREEAPWAGGAG